MKFPIEIVSDDKSNKICKRSSIGTSNSIGTNRFWVINCIFGFLETDEGYKGILVITEYQNKKPLCNTASAKVIASHLINYISIFVCSKGVLADQGKEFFNQI